MYLNIFMQFLTGNIWWVDRLISSGVLGFNLCSASKGNLKLQSVLEYLLTVIVCLMASATTVTYMHTCMQNCALEFT